MRRGSSRTMSAMEGGDVTVSVQRGGVFCKKPPSHLADLHVEN